MGLISGGICEPLLTLSSLLPRFTLKELYSIHLFSLS